MTRVPYQESRAHFMETSGKEIYNTWIKEVLRHTTIIDDTLYAHVNQDPLPKSASTEDRLTRFADGMKHAFQAVTKTHDTGKILAANNNLLREYVAVEAFNGYEDHALDSMNQGVRFPNAIAFDAMRDTYGERDPSTEIAFLRDHVGATSLLMCVKDCTKTGFFFWKDSDTWSEFDRNRRAERFELPAGTPITNYDMATDTFSLHPRVPGILSGYMNTQNMMGPDENVGWAGMPYEDTPFTSGCPVGNTGALRVSKFIAPRLELVIG